MRKNKICKCNSWGLSSFFFSVIQDTERQTAKIRSHCLQIGGPQILKILKIYIQWDGGKKLFLFSLNAISKLAFPPIMNVSNIVK